MKSFRVVILALITASVGLGAAVVLRAQSLNRVEDTGSAPPTYAGTWTLGDTTRAWSGGTAAHSQEALARATFNFTGTAVTWIGFRGPQAGIARIFLDGTVAETVDTYAPTEQVQVILFTRSGLSVGAHTLVIEVTGEKNPSSTAWFIVVDAVDVDGIRIQDTGSGTLAYAGSWMQGDTSRAWSSGTAAHSQEALARATFNFTGTAVTWIGFRGPQTGIARIFLDGTLAETVDTYAATEQLEVALFTRTALAAGAHTLAIEVTGEKNPSSSGWYIVVDAFDVQPASLWPNEPPSSVTVSDQPWNQVIGNGWSYLRRTASKDSDIVSDGAAPLSPQNVLRIIFTPDMAPDTEPGVHWIGLARPTEIYTGWWIKLSPNWTCSPAGCGKMTFLFPDEANGPGVTYSNLAGVNGSHYVNIATTWSETGYTFWEPNLTKTPLHDDQWYRIEWYVKWASVPGAADGIIQWWVNGVPNGDYRNVPFPSIRGFTEFQHAPTLQTPPPAEQYMYIDHTRISTPGS